MKKPHFWPISMLTAVLIYYLLEKFYDLWKTGIWPPQLPVLLVILTLSLGILIFIVSYLTSKSLWNDLNLFKKKPILGLALLLLLVLSAVVFGISFFSLLASL
ncbi:MAG: hypothetical protein CVU44_20575 [Chloroflexi bacterium HGW-Chloroflexi-6]|nr:MAG: hypothetical protein CVU44_20575 [Chloroflexi bacterium HGW-Chloroflexi-6]